jgi:hypothetical protein
MNGHAYTVRRPFRRRPERDRGTGNDIRHPRTGRRLERPPVWIQRAAAATTPIESNHQASTRAAELRLSLCRRGRTASWSECGQECSRPGTGAAGSARFGQALWRRQQHPSWDTRVAVRAVCPEKGCMNRPPSGIIRQSLVSRRYKSAPRLAHPPRGHLRNDASRRITGSKLSWPRPTPTATSSSA